MKNCRTIETILDSIKAYIYSLYSRYPFCSANQSISCTLHATAITAPYHLSTRFLEITIQHVISKTQTNVCVDSCCHENICNNVPLVTMKSSFSSLLRDLGPLAQSNKNSGHKNRSQHYIPRSLTHLRHTGNTRRTKLKPFVREDGG